MTITSLFRITSLPSFPTPITWHLLLGRPIIHRLDTDIDVLGRSLEIPLEDLLDRLALGDDHRRWQMRQRREERRRCLSRVLLEDGALEGVRTGYVGQEEGDSLHDDDRRHRFDDRYGSGQDTRVVSASGGECALCTVVPCGFLFLRDGRGGLESNAKGTCQSR